MSAPQTALACLLCAAALVSQAAAQMDCPGLPPLPDNAVPADCLGGSVSGNTCEAACAAGFVLQGNPEYFCGRDGQYYGGCGFACTDWELAFGFEYYFSKDFGTPNEPFQFAQQVCESLNANLVSIHTREENNFVFELIGGSNKQPAWIGTVKDLSGRDVSPFDWLNVDGTPFDIYDAYPECTEGQGTVDQNCVWFFGDPNNLENNEQCVQMGQRDAAVSPAVWNDADCDSKRGFV